MIYPKPYSIYFRGIIGTDTRHALSHGTCNVGECRTAYTPGNGFGLRKSRVLVASCGEMGLQA